MKGVVSRAAGAALVVLACASARGQDGASVIVEGERQFDVVGDYVRSREMLEEGLKIVPQDDHLSRARGLIALSKTLAALGRVAEAKSRGEEGLTEARLAGDRREEARGLGYLGDAYYYDGQLEDALRSFEAGGAIMVEIGDQLGQAFALKNAGIACRTLGRYDEALAYLNPSARALDELCSTDGAMSAYGNLGTTYAVLNNRRLALAAFERARELSGTDTRLLCDAVERIALLRADMGDLEGALGLHRQALELAGNNVTPFTRLWIQLDMATTLHVLGRDAEAIEILDRTLATQREVDDSLGMTDTLRLRGGILCEEEPERAILDFERALEILEQHGGQRLWAVLSGMGHAQATLGDLDRAIATLNRAVDELDGTRASFSADLDRSTFLGQHQDIYRELAAALLARARRDGGGADVAAAFDVHERALARSTLDALATSGMPGDDLTPELREKRRDLASRTAKVEERLRSGGLAPDEEGLLLDQMADLDRELDLLVVRIRKANPRYAALRFPEPRGAEDIQQSIDEDTALLSYVQTRDAIDVFVVTRGSVAVERLPVAPGVLRQRVQNYVDLLERDRDDTGLTATARRIADDVLAPALHALPARVTRLLVVPDGPLFFLPFEALPSPRGSRYLVQDFVCSYAPSATVLRELAERSRAEPRADLLLFADPAPARGTTFGGDRWGRALYEDEGLSLAPLPGTRREALRIERFASRDSEVKTGAAASEAAVKSMDLGAFKVLHFATHGLLSERAPARSALLLSPSAGAGEDGFLQAREIYQLRIGSDLVVLSACQTARGQVLAGDGVQGLARAFFHAGARSVLASIANVDDAASAELMTAFYRHLASGLAKADALQKAKLDMLASPRTSLPGLWGSFILIGEGQDGVPLRPARLRPAPVVIGGVVGVVFLLALAAVRRYAT